MKYRENLVFNFSRRHCVLRPSKGPSPLRSSLDGCVQYALFCFLEDEERIEARHSHTCSRRSMSLEFMESRQIATLNLYVIFLTFCRPDITNSELSRGRAPLANQYRVQYWGRDCFVSVQRPKFNFSTLDNIVDFKLQRLANGSRWLLCYVNLSRIAHMKRFVYLRQE